MKWLEKRFVNFAERDSKVRVSKMIWTSHHYYTGGAGEGGGFQRNSESMPQTALVNANLPFKCKAVSSLAADSIWTN